MIPLRVLKTEPFFEYKGHAPLERKHYMPFIIGPAVGGAVAAVGVAAAAGTAATIGAAAVATVGAIAAVATVAGLAMTVVGLATGNQKLMKIGAIVGLAGGVTGMATSAISASLTAGTAALGSAEAAIPAASAGAGSSAAGGLTSASGTAMTNAITPAFSTGVSGTTGSAIGGATTGSLSSGTGFVGSLGSAGGAALSSVAPATASIVGAGTSSAVGAGVDAATKVASQGTSFFDYITSPQGVMEIGKVGAGMLQGSAQQDMMDKKLAIDNSNNLYNQMANERAYQNANTQGHLKMTARQLTPEEVAANADAKAAAARRSAQILTAPAS